MNIGQPKRIIEIEPASIPVPDTGVPFPEATPAPEPVPEPVPETGREP
jgi:hypothetical protein